MPKIIDRVVTVVGCVMAVYHLASTQYLIWGSTQHKVTHLGFSLLLVFLVGLRDHKKQRMWPLSFILIGVTVFTIGYILIDFEYLQVTTGFITKPMQFIAGVLIVVLVFEGTRRAWGPILLVVASILGSYLFLGVYLPEPFTSFLASTELGLSKLGIGFEGTLGTTLMVSANMVFLFLLFGGLLQVSGAMNFIFEFSKLLGRGLVSGPAQTAVIGSSMLGTVTGASVANVTLTGSFTIPLMKRLGYTPEWAGAVESVASTGSQITPPVMGDAAFLLAEFMRVSYTAVMLAGIIPAAMFYLPVFLGVEIISRKQGLKRVLLDVDRKILVTCGPVFVIPLLVIFSLLILRFTPMYAAFYGIVSILVVSSFRKETRLSPSMLARGLSVGAVAGAKVCMALSIVGVMFVSVTTTGLGITFGTVAEALCRGNLFLLLLLTMVITIILGCGLATVAAYAIPALVVAPVLINMGVEPIAAHFFCFYFAIISTITPPVALTSLAATGIAGGNFWRTAISAVKLAAVSFVIPFMLVYNPALLLQPGHTGWPIVLVALAMGMICLVVSVHGYFFMRTAFWERVLYIITTLVIFTYGFTHNISLFFVGAPLFIGMMLLEWRKVRRERKKERITASGELV